MAYFFSQLDSDEPTPKEKRQRKIRKVMHEFKEGELMIGRSDKPVKSRKQAIAIALNSKLDSMGYIRFDFSGDEITLQPLTVRPSCSECLEKHLGAAMVLLAEAETDYPEHRLLAIGHLHEAEEESRAAWPEISLAIRQMRKDLQQQNITPDFYELARLLQFEDGVEDEPVVVAINRMDAAGVEHLDAKGDGKPCGRGFINKNYHCSDGKRKQLAADLKAGDAGAKRRVEIGKRNAKDRQALKREVQRDKGKKARVFKEDPKSKTEGLTSLNLGYGNQPREGYITVTDYKRKGYPGYIARITSKNGTSVDRAFAKSDDTDRETFQGKRGNIYYKTSSLKDGVYEAQTKDTGYSIRGNSRHYFEIKDGKVTRQFNDISDATRNGLGVKPIDENMPPLSGSEKQISWAESIRTKGLAKTHDAIRQKAPSEKQAELAIQQVQEIASKRTNSRDWIDNRENIPKWLISQLQNRSDSSTFCLDRNPYRDRMGQFASKVGVVASPVASWAAGKVAGGALASVAAAHGIDPGMAQHISESAVQALATVGQKAFSKPTTAKQFAKDFVIESAAVFAGKMPYTGFDDAVLGGDNEVADVLSLAIANRSNIGAVLNGMGKEVTTVGKLLKRKGLRMDAVDWDDLNQDELEALFKLSLVGAVMSSERLDAADNVNEVYAKYKATINMSASELEEWAETDASKQASLNRSPIKRNLRLLSKPKSEWDANDVRDANRTISFVSRMKRASQGEADTETGYSKRDVSLKNWAYDPGKERGDSLGYIYLDSEGKPCGDGWIAKRLTCNAGLAVQGVKQKVKQVITEIRKPKEQRRQEASVRKAAEIVANQKTLLGTGKGHNLVNFKPLSGANAKGKLDTGTILNEYRSHALSEKMGVGLDEARQINRSLGRYTGQHYSNMRAVEAGRDDDVSPAWKERYQKDIENLNRYMKVMPKYEGEVSRGLSFSSDEKREAFMKKLTDSGSMSLDAMSSWSSDPEVANRFASQDDDGEGLSRGVVLRTQNKSGVSVRAFSDIPWEDEVLTPKGTRYRLKNQSRDEKGNIVLDLEEF